MPEEDPAEGKIHITHLKISQLLCTFTSSFFWASQVKASKFERPSVFGDMMCLVCDGHHR